MFEGSAAAGSFRRRIRTGYSVLVTSEVALAVVSWWARDYF